MPEFSSRLLALFSNRIFPILCAAVMLVQFVLVHGAQAQVTTVKPGSWSDPAVWSGGSLPQDGERVVIEHEVTLDRNSAKLKSLEIRQGKLTAIKDTLFIDSAFSGAGTFEPGKGTVDFISKENIAIDGIARFYDLTLADSSAAFGSRSIEKDLLIEGKFEADFRKSDSARITGIGSIRVGGDLTYVGASARGWTGTVHLDDVAGQDTSWLVIVPIDHTNFADTSAADTSAADASYAFPQIIIDKSDTTQLVRVGRPGRYPYPLIGDTLYVSSSSAIDTSIVLRRGTLDLVRGHIRSADSQAAPLVYIGKNARYRTGARGELDTAFMSHFILDTNSTFEFYSDSVKDITYSMQRFSQPYFWNLWLGAPTLTGLGTQDLEIRGRLLIQNGAEINPRAGLATHHNAKIIIHGDVINESKGESGSVGAGTGGGDGMSPLDEQWIFDHSGDTIHWSGPAEMQRVTVKEGTVLSVRFIDHDHCDSLLFIDSITEEGGSCGARIIGKIFTTPYRFYQLSEKTHNFGNIGLTITSGEPYLQLTRVTRYAGYLPPGERLGIQPERTVKRYFNVVPGAGPQSLVPSRMKFDLHCDDINGVDLDQAVFWRSTSGGHSWGYNGITRRDVSALSFIRDSSDLGFPYNANSFLWTLSTQRDDIATPILLESFNLSRELAKVKLNWRTSSEINVRGFAVDRVLDGREDRISSCESSPELLSRSLYGAAYELDDALPTNGTYTYKLVEISLDGLERTLATKQIRISDLEKSREIFVQPVRAGNKVGIQLIGEIEAGLQVEVFDAAGRVLLHQFAPRSQDPVLDLDTRGIASQLVFVTLSGPAIQKVVKVLLPAY